MNDSDLPDDDSPDRLNEALAEQLRPLPVPDDGGIARRLAQRVRRSAESQLGLSTLRREDGAWTTAGPGLQQRLLCLTAGTRVELWRLAPGATLGWPGDSLAREILVLEGAVQDALDDGILPRFGYRLGEIGPQRAGDDGALLYLRHRLQPLDRLDAGEARWWRTAPAVPQIADAQAPALKLARGVRAVNLHSNEAIVTMLVRVVGGACVPDHAHALEEDCFVLEGDLYLSDILLRAGDYQTAAAGTRHTDCLSEAGAIFYFRGPLPAPA